MPGLKPPSSNQIAKKRTCVGVFSSSSSSSGVSMQDFVVNWVATGVVVWTVAFLAVRKALPHRSFNFCSRLVSMMHACTVVGLATFSVQDWSCPVFPLGAISSPCQMKISSVTLSYLTYDAVCSLFDNKRVDVSNLLHHTVGIVGTLTGLAYEMCGSEMVAAIWITEISNPFLHLREFLKELGYKDTYLNLAILFAVTFSSARMVCGPYLLIVVLMADYPLLMKAMGLGLQLVSAFWFYKIAKMVRYKLQVKRNTHPKVA